MPTPHNCQAPPDEAEEEGIKAFSKLEQHLSS
jgi:hypothetical protein